MHSASWHAPRTSPSIRRALDFPHPRYPTHTLALALLCTSAAAQNVDVDGRVDLDLVVPHGGDGVEADVGEIETDAEVRRARLRIRGDLLESLRGLAQVELSEDEIGFRSVYFELRDLPGGSAVRVGSFREPFGLERQASTRNVVFLERALSTELAPNRNTGIAWLTAFGDSPTSLAVGVFRDPGGKLDLGPDDDAWSLTARSTWLPHHDDGSGDVVHLGAAVSHRWIGDGNLSFASRPELRLLPTFVRTGTFAADRELKIGAEAAWVQGSSSVQAEFVESLTFDDTGSARLHGGYVQVSHFLTGERRAYDPRRRRFGRVEPLGDLFDGLGGAVELKLRLSMLDFGSRFAPDERLVDVTTGVNWYWNRSMRLMADVVYGERSDFGSVVALGLRFQIDF